MDETQRASGEGNVPNWILSSEPKSIADGRIHVWRIGLEADETALSRMRTVLDDYEQSRADRFKFDKHRRRFIVGRFALRTLLGKYLAREPASLRYEYSGHGKPSLVAEELSFNLSNSHELALVAVTTNRRVGVDVEHLRTMPDALKLAARFFTETETAALRLAPEKELQQSFFRTWTRKEAILKASGEGLSRPLNSFDVSPIQGPLFVETPDGFDRPTMWRLQDLSLGDEYMGAIAADGEEFPMELFEMRSVG